jgi:hypothetical protein
VWRNVKHDRIGRAGIASGSRTLPEALAALERISRAPGFIKAFCGDPDLHYILN